jgi:hypothetical protein
MLGSGGGTAIAEYGSRFEADVARACLADHGLDSAVLCDPAADVAPNLVTDPGFRLLVHADDVEEARAALGLDRPRDLEAERLDAHFFWLPMRQRPRWHRVLALLALLALPVSWLAMGVMLLVRVLVAAFP